MYPGSQPDPARVATLNWFSRVAVAAGGQNGSMIFRVLVTFLLIELGIVSK